MILMNDKVRTDHLAFWKFDTVFYGILSLIILPACFGRTILFFTDQSNHTQNYFNGLLLVWILEIIFLASFIFLLRGFRLLKKSPELIGVHPNHEDLLRNGISPDLIKSYIKSKYLGILFSILLIAVTLIFVLLILPHWLTYDQKLAFSAIFDASNILKIILIIFSPYFIVDGVISLKYGIVGGLPTFVSVKKFPIPIKNNNLFEPFQVKKYGLHPPYWIGRKAKTFSMIQILVSALLILWSIYRLIR